MIVSVASPSPPSTVVSMPLFTRPCGFSPLSSLISLERKSKKWEKLGRIGNWGGRRSKGICRAELVQDAPFAAAIGACFLTSLVSPISSPGGPDDEDAGTAIDSTDARFAVMGIISFIPYFNWMSWVFAWLDSGKQRYLVYSIVYLAPYLRTNLSLSPDESWLPIASIVLCIIHIQLEASIRNGDLNGIQPLTGVLKFFSPLIQKEETEFQNHQGYPEEDRSTKQGDLPSAQKRSHKFQERGIPRKSVDDPHHLNENPDVYAEENKSD